VSAEPILAIIPARGGSQGIPNKNLRKVGGVTLVARSVLAAVDSGCFDQVMVSTDDEAIAAAARAAGASVPWLRPADLAGPDAAVIDAVLHALDRFCEDELRRPKAVALLQPTSPFRDASVIRRGIEMFRGGRGASVVAVSPTPEHPYWCRQMDEDGCLQPFVPGAEVPANRQSLPPAYRINGSLYIATVDVLRDRRSFYADRTLGFVMDPSDGLDIDTPADLTLARRMWRGRAKGTP
jgi:CMP-N,N'-diacetyllegionaminic acid synthase